MTRKFRKKPVIIEAVQLDFGTLPFILAWASPYVKEGDAHLLVRTLEGTMRADVGDWIIKGVAGEFYPIKDPIFRETYEPVEN